MKQAAAPGFPDDSTAMAKVANKDRFYENKWFWVVAFGAVILISAVAGFYTAGGNIERTIETVQYANKTRAIEGPEELAEKIRTEAIARTFDEVLKLIQAGVIQRLNEPGRQLYVNDPVWEVMSMGRKEHTARVVAEYLDWVNDQHTGMLNIYSFRSGQRIAEINRARAFRVVGR